jgi:hypothetical protein
VKEPIVTRRTLRLAALAAVAVLVLPLAACQTHQGTVAYVGKTRITTDQLDEQLDKFYDDPNWAKRGAGDPRPVRTRLLYTMVMAELFKQAANSVGGKVTPAEQATLVAELVKSPATIDQQFQGALTGATPEVFAKAYGHLRALESQLSKTEGSPDAATAKFQTMVSESATRYRVKLNPRYGKFDAKTLNIVPSGEAGVRNLPAPTPTEPALPEQPQEGQQPPAELPQEGQQPPAEPPPGQPVPETQPSPAN